MTRKNTTQLLVSASDPLLMHVRLKNYKNNLSHLISNFFIGVAFGSRIRPHEELDEIAEYFEYLRNDDYTIAFLYPDEDTQNHGSMISNIVTEYYDLFDENILLMEDDDFILNKNTLEKHIHHLNNGDYDFVGDPRGCSGNLNLLEFQKSVMKQDKVLYNHDDPCAYHFGNYWPTHFLIKKKYLKPTDIFRAYFYPAGTQLNYRGKKFLIDTDTDCDTFVKFSIDMMSRINRGYEYSLYDCRLHNQDANDAYYFHLGMIQRPDFNFSDDIYNKILDYYIYHIGSASCFLRFHVKNSLHMDDDFISSLNFLLQNNDSINVVQLYRRYVVYKAIFETVKNDTELSAYKSNYLENFAQVDEYFDKNDIKGILERTNCRITPGELYTHAFKQIVGY